MRWLKKYLSLIFLAVLTSSASWFMMSRERVEEYYSKGFYPHVSSALRCIFGYLPFSVGDLLYAVLIVFMLFQFFLFCNSLFRETNKLQVIMEGFARGVQVILFFWVLFHALWGFNYYRLSIPDRFELSKGEVSNLELVNLAQFSLEEINRYAPGRKLDHHLTEATSIRLAYDSLSKYYPSLNLSNISHKSSMFGVLGNYMGYGGYYNPFTGEAQINDRMPSFLLPFISLHELAHQLGNAKESEANFIGYLAAMHTSDSSILYSANLELFLYTTAALRKTDSLTVKQLYNELSPIAQNDIKEYEEFVQQYYGPVDRFVTSFYSGFLRMNNQPDGLKSYNKGMLYVMRYLQKKGRIPRPL